MVLLQSSWSGLLLWFAEEHGEEGIMVVVIFFFLKNPTKLFNLSAKEM